MQSLCNKFESEFGLKVFFAVFICRVLHFIGKQVGKGSSFPGKVVLRIFPDVLKELKLPETIIAVTGSNGKTTTTELIVKILEVSGMNVGWNREGSNQTEGIATLLLRVASLSGKVKCDAVVMECDERYAKKIFENVKPSALLVTNLCRDQLTRNGHPEFIGDCLHAAIEAAGGGVSTGGGVSAAGGVSVGGGVKLVLNADDPYVAALGAKQADVLWFGISPENGKQAHTGIYDDTVFCPMCKQRMTYTYYIAGHYGSYDCKACGLTRHEPDVEATVRDDGFLVFGDGIKMKMNLPIITGAYNFCAAVAAARAVGIDVPDSVRALDGYELTGGRTIRLAVGKDDNRREGLLLLSKHENSFAYDMALTWIIKQKKPCTVIVLVDAISRKYYTSETSWLWDINFDLLADDCVESVVLAGRYVNELAARFVMTEVDQTKIGYVADLSELREYVLRNTDGDIHAVTCFSDKVKLLKALN